MISGVEISMCYPIQTRASRIQETPASRSCTHVDWWPCLGLLPEGRVINISLYKCMEGSVMNAGDGISLTPFFQHSTAVKFKGKRSVARLAAVTPSWHIFTSEASFCNALTKSDTIQRVSRPFPSKGRLPPIPRAHNCHRAVGPYYFWFERSNAMNAMETIDGEPCICIE
jgi:hypothetical protein